MIAAKLSLTLFLGALGALALKPPTVLLHLSDIHLSNNVAQTWRAFGDREGDMELFVQRLVPLLGPQAAVVITGDLTDSKNLEGAGLQQEEEWQAYRRILDALAAAGVPEHRVLDVRGNHDVFNMPLRGGPNDFFTRYAAEGRRNNGTLAKRAFAHLLLPAAASSQQQQQQQQGEGAAAGQLTAGSTAAAEVCPALGLLGIDVSPEPGLRSPANFAGVSTPALLRGVEEELASLLASVPAGCPQPLLLAFGHYPLSVFDSQPQRAGPGGMLAHLSRSVHSMQGVAQLLAEHNVTAYLNGHLHAAFGHRLHRLHATPAGGHMAELETAAWKDDRRFRIMADDGGALSFADLFFHTPNSPSRPGRKEDRMAIKENAWIEAYQERGYAVTPADTSAEVIHHIAMITWPPDARYSPLAPGSLQELQQQEQLHQQPLLQQHGAGAEEAAAALRSRGLLGSGGSGAGRGEDVVAEGIVGGAGMEAGTGDEAGVRQLGLVRALVFPVDQKAAESPQLWEVTLRSWLPGGEEFAPAVTMQLAAGTAGSGAAPAGKPTASSAASPALPAPQLLFQATLTADLNCSHKAHIAWRKADGEAARHAAAVAACPPPADQVFIQVEVRGRDGHVSSSPAQAVGLQCTLLPLLPGQDRGQQRCGPAPNSVPAPLGTSRFEWLVLAVNWPVLGHRILVLTWCCHMALLLLLPRLLCANWGPRISASPLFRPRSLALLSTNPAPAAGSPPNKQRASWQGAPVAASRVAVGAVRTLGGHLLWPAAALVLLAGEPVAWTAVVLYCLYLAAGPWFTAAFLSDYPGAMLFHYGVLARVPPAGGGRPAWRFIPTCDTMFVSMIHLVFCVIPITLWVACVVGSRQLAQHPQRALHQRTPSRPGSSSSSAGSGNGGSSAAGAPGSSGSAGKGAAVGKLWQALTLPQLLALVCVLGLNWWGAYDKAAKLTGPLAVLLSPGFVWTIPLAVVLVLASQLTGRRSSCMGKRE